jgi:hypothetical protein
MHANPPLQSGVQAGTSGRPKALSACTLRPALAGAVLLAAGPASVLAFTATLTPAAPQTIYLQVGVGSFSGGTGACPYNNLPSCYDNGGTPGNNATVNTVSTSVPLASVGNGTAQAMTTDSTAADSYYDGYTFCTVPGQLYIGGFFRTAGGTTAAAQVTATVPAALTDPKGDTLPFSKISWTSSGNGDAGAEPFPAGTFVNGGVQTVGTMASNTWNESCWTFSYANNTTPASGFYTGTVTYTMTAP